MAPFRHLLPAALILTACGAAQRPMALDQMQSMRESPSVQASRGAAPQAFAEAEQLASAASAAWEAGDPELAVHLSRMAAVAYRQAVVLARHARAELAAASAAERVQRLESELAKLEAEQASLEAEARDLELRAKVLRDAEPLAPVDASSPAREGARRAAAKALLAEAKLLCISETLIREDRDAATDALLTEIDGQLAQLPTGAGAALIEASRRLRAACLERLTLARRPATRKLPNAGLADALLADLGQVPGLHPFRDDRGVVVLLGNPATGTNLAPGAERALHQLADVAAAHPEFSLLVVWHSAPTDPDEQAAQLLGKAKELLDPAGKLRITSELVGSAQPLVPPGSPDSAKQNRRIEVIFVSPSVS